MLLRKGTYPYEYMDEQGKFDETTLPEREEFYNNVNMEDIRDRIISLRKEFVKTLK